MINKTFHLIQFDGSKLFDTASYPIHLIATIENCPDFDTALHGLLEYKPIKWFILDEYYGNDPDNHDGINDKFLKQIFQTSWKNREIVSFALIDESEQMWQIVFNLDHLIDRTSNFIVSIRHDDCHFQIDSRCEYSRSFGEMERDQLISAPVANFIKDKSFDLSSK